MSDRLQELRDSVEGAITDRIYDGMRGFGRDWAIEQAKTYMARIDPFFDAILADGEERDGVTREVVINKLAEQVREQRARPQDRRAPGPAADAGLVKRLACELANRSRPHHPHGPQGGSEVSELDQRILRLRTYGNRLTLREIAEDIGVTESRVYSAMRRAGLQHQRRGMDKRTRGK